MGLIVAEDRYDEDRGAWSTIAFHYCRGFMQQAIRTAKKQRAAQLEGDIAGNGDPSEHAATAELVELVRSTLGRLGLNGRMVAEVLLDGKSMAEAGRGVGLARETVRVRVARGLRSLHAILGGGGCAELPWVLERMR